MTGCFNHDNELPGSVKVGVFLDQLSNCHLQEVPSMELVSSVSRKKIELILRPLSPFRGSVLTNYDNYIPALLFCVLTPYGNWWAGASWIMWLHDLEIFTYQTVIGIQPVMRLQRVFYWCVVLFIETNLLRTFIKMLYFSGKMWLDETWFVRMIRERKVTASYESLWGQKEYEYKTKDQNHAAYFFIQHIDMRYVLKFWNV
jgi:hypothetical protein